MGTTNRVKEMPASGTGAPGLRTPQISVIIPARNEEASLGACLESILSQFSSSFPFEVIVVNDHSTDRTREIAASTEGVRLIDAPDLPAGWTGKNNAVWAGARAARFNWLLFTDADTLHLPGSLERSLDEARGRDVSLLSYSPEQIVTGVWERALMPVIFAELASRYKPSEVSDPRSPAAAANGQYILISREAYDAVGGHAAIAGEILEDVALARAVKRSGRKIFFRYGGDAVRTRMYRTFAQMREGWTKNLALLFPQPGMLAALRFAEFLLLLGSLALLTAAILRHDVLAAILSLIAPTVTFRRIVRAHFSWSANALVFLGLPLFSYLLLRSKLAHEHGNVRWKGRGYAGGNGSGKPDAAQNIGETVSKTPVSKTPVSTTTISKTPMKIALVLMLALLLANSLSLSAAAQADGPHFSNTTIEPGLSLGPLKIGDDLDHALALFPQKAEDQQWDDPCGTTYDWVDAANSMGRGDVYIRVKKGKVFQIESSTTRFQTAEGITTFVAPDKVASTYKDMRAYVLLTPPSAALGDRPLVFWVDKKKGIAFALAYDPSQHKRYVYKTIVFAPKGEFCPEQEQPSSPKWQSIRNNSLEPPPELSPELR